MTATTPSQTWDIPSHLEVTKTYHKKPYPAIDPRRPGVSAAGKILFITGGGTGIGRSIVESFAQANIAHVILIGRRQAVIEDAVSEFTAAHAQTKFHGFSTSVADQQSVNDLFVDIRETIGEPDILVTCAADNPGIFKTLEIPNERMIEAFHTNVFGNLNLVRAFMKGISTDDVTDKVILEVSSSAAFRMYEGSATYSACKSSFARIMQQVQYEYWDTGLRVFSFHPGTIQSEITKGRLTGKNVPWDDVGLPGHFAVWLASPEAGFLKGRYLWAHWDVEELKAKRDEIESDKSLLRLGLITR